MYALDSVHETVRSMKWSRLIQTSKFYMRQTWLLVAVYGSSTFEPGLKNIKMLKYTLIDENSCMQHKMYT